MSFEDEIKGYSIEELRLIINTQKDLYTEEEIDALIKRLAAKKREAGISDEPEKPVDLKIKNRVLPEIIACTKCDGPNNSKDEVCVFCGVKLDKSQYVLPWNNETGEEENSTSSYEKSGYGFHYFVSFFIPLVGFIVGAILLGNDASPKVEKGKTCIILAIISLLISSFLAFCILLS